MDAQNLMRRYIDDMPRRTNVMHLNVGPGLWVDVGNIENCSFRTNVNDIYFVDWAVDSSQHSIKRICELLKISQLLPSTTKLEHCGRQRLINADLER